MLRQLFASLRPKPSANRPARNRAPRLAVETLEERWLLATFTWIGPTSDGDFNTAANWRD